LSQLHQISTNFDIFLAQVWQRGQNSVRCIHFPPQLIHINSSTHSTHYRVKRSLTRIKCGGK